MFKKSAKDIENSSAHYQTKKIVCSTDYKTFFTNLNSVYFALKSAKEIDTKRKKLSAQRIAKLKKLQRNLK